MSIADRPNLKVFICWPHISGYASACWRRLQATPGIDLKIIAFPVTAQETATEFDNSLVAGLRCHLLSTSERNDYDRIRALVVEHQPQIVMVSGWAIPNYVRLAREPALAGARFIMAMDTPWRGTLRQYLGRFKIGGYLSRIDRVLVPGERSWQFARHLGMPESRIRRGLYGFDYELIKPLLDRRLNRVDGWPRRFLYVGRYVQDKAIDVLMAAYAAYRRNRPDAWPLTCCGRGPLEALVRATAGVEDRGFVQPNDLPQVMAEHGAFVLASRFDPWPLVLTETVGAGLPVICSEACGSAVEVVRPYYNGLVVPTGDVAALTRALEWCHDNHSLLPGMGARGQPLAAAYSAAAWAERMRIYFEESCHEPRA